MIEDVHDAVAHYFEAYPGRGAWWALGLVVAAWGMSILVEIVERWTRRACRCRRGCLCRKESPS